MSTVPEILQLLRESRFDDAIPLVEESLRRAAAESPQKLTDAAREIVRWQGFFKNTAQAITSERYFRSVHGLLAELAGPESPAAMAAADNLGSLLGSIDKADEAIALRERVLAHLRGRFPNDDQRVMTVRDGLSILYQRAGREDKLKELYQDTGVCEHLRQAESYIRDQGGRVVSVGRPWSANCRTWVYFDTILDAESLIAGLHLDACVAVHDHRGTHDGSERGIVCRIHHDGVMGPHPSNASSGARTVK
ncbi:MAG TPA: tetratricopeptide repeat protein [Terriglobia bacterium]|nr:tetratricopeptide repeat protein [Terriglobia bacterium]